MIKWTIHRIQYCSVFVAMGLPATTFNWNSNIKWKCSKALTLTVTEPCQEECDKQYKVCGLYFKTMTQCCVPVWGWLHILSEWRALHSTVAQ